MAYLRHASRHIHETVYQHMTYHLDALGWMDTVTPPFGGTPLTMQSVMPEEYEQWKKLGPGRCAVSIGDTDDDIELELGSDFVGLDIPFFFDCKMDTEGATLALADDVRDILKGRVTGTSMALAVFDFVDDPPTARADYMLWLTDTARVRPGTNWQVVNATFQVQHMPYGASSQSSGGYPSASLFPSSSTFPGEP